MDLNSNHSNSAYPIIETTDERILVGITPYQYAPSTIVKLDNYGDEIWQSQLDCGNMTCKATSFFRLLDGSTVMFGVGIDSQKSVYRLWKSIISDDGDFNVEFFGKDYNYTNYIPPVFFI